MFNLLNNNVTLIGEDFFPVDLVSEEAEKEKNGRSKTFEMHYWWTRKPLIASRASILASSVSNDIQKRDILRILGLDDEIKNRKKRSFKTSPASDLPLLRKEFKKVFGTERPDFLDPFAGGGSLPYEALRLGFNVTASDYNPVSWMILKATLEFPKTMGNNLYERVKNSFAEMRKRLHSILGKFYDEEVEENLFPSAYIYSWAVKCPFCDFITPLVNNWVLKKKTKESSFVWEYLVPNASDEFKCVFKIIKCISKDPKTDLNIPQAERMQEGNCKRGKGRCVNCLEVIENHYIIEDIKKNSRELKLATVYNKKIGNGKIYKVTSDLENSLLQNLERRIKEMESYIPSSEMHNGIIGSARYLNSWNKLYNLRQRYFFANFVKISIKIAKEYSDKYGENWGKIIAIYFSLLLGKMVIRNCRSTLWHHSTEKITHALSFRGLSMVWNHAEINPFAEKGSGTYKSAQKGVLDGLNQAVEHLSNTIGTVDVKLSSVLTLPENRFDLILTDPPYGDDVPYSELSDFFYSWQQIILHNFFDFLPIGNVPSSEDLSDNRKDRDEEFVKIGLSESFQKLNTLLSETGKFTLFFAHSKLEIWSFVVLALQEASFWIISAYPIHTENPNNVIARGKASFLSSIILICQMRKGDKVAFFKEIEEEMLNSVRKKVRKFRSDGIRGADLSLACLGPAFKVLTEYKEIKSMGGDFDVKEILGLTNRPLTQEVLGNFMSKVSELDGISTLYLFARLNGMAVIPYDTLAIFSKSYNFSVTQLGNLFTMVSSGRRATYTFNSYLQRELGKKEELSIWVDVIHKAMWEFDNRGERGFFEVIDVPENRMSMQDAGEFLFVITQGVSDEKKVANILEADSKKALEILTSIRKLNSYIRNKPTEHKGVIEYFSGN